MPVPTKTMHFYTARQLAAMSALVAHFDGMVGFEQMGRSNDVHATILDHIPPTVVLTPPALIVDIDGNYRYTVQPREWSNGGVRTTQLLSNVLRDLGL